MPAALHMYMCIQVLLCSQVECIPEGSLSTSRVALENKLAADRRHVLGHHEDKALCIF